MDPPPATRRRGGYSENLAGGQPGPTRAAPPAAFGVAARGDGSCGGCGSGGRPQRGANQPDDAADSGQVRACDMRATCLHSVLRSVREGKGQGREGEAGRAQRDKGRRRVQWDVRATSPGTRAPGGGKVKREWEGCLAYCSAKCVPGG